MGDLARASSDADRWAAWLLRRRDGEDPEQRALALDYLRPIRERVLERASMHTGDVVLDVGAGDGLIAFGAAERVGPSGTVIFSDASEDLLSHSRDVADELGYVDRISFVRAAAEELDGVEDGTVDVVTTRSVLIYVEDKAAAFRAFHRVLRSSGRLSIFEPINSYFPESFDDFWGFDARPVRDLVAKIWEYEGWIGEATETDPMLNFTEKDLLQHAESAGFEAIHLEFHVDVKPGTWVVDWERLLETSPNPNAHTAREAIEGALTKDEAARLESQIRPLADEGRGVLRDASAYLSATKR
jgi:arsenite methyltransferase